MTNGANTLVLTVGTGNVEEIEATLLEPIRKSIAKGDWRRVILLPSRVTETTAKQIQYEQPEGTIEIAPLPKPGDEYDPDGCFAHFDQVLSDLLAAGVPRSAITVDFTRGTKVMSAALVLAATRRDVPTLRYITGDQRDSRHMVVPGTEDVRDGTTAYVTTARRLDAARGLFERGNFSAVVELLGQSDMNAVPDSLRRQLEDVKKLAAFCAAWDRLDYISAAECAPDIDALALPEDWKALAPLAAARDFVRLLASETRREAELRTPDNYADMAYHLCRLCADLIPNARRRVAQAQYEDASIRVYRITELIGQAALFDEGYDSEFMPKSDPAVAEFIAKVTKKKSNDIRDSVGRDDCVSFPRDKTARFLKRFDEELGQWLFEFGNDASIRARNKSLLIHGFQATGPKDAKPLEDNLDSLEYLLVQTFLYDAEYWLEVAETLPPRESPAS